MQIIAMTQLAIVCIILRAGSECFKVPVPVPKDDSRRVITFANQEDYISFRYVECTCVHIEDLHSGTHTPEIITPL